MDAVGRKVALTFNCLSLILSSDWSDGFDCYFKFICGLFSGQEEEFKAISSELLFQFVRSEEAPLTAITDAADLIISPSMTDH